MFFNFNLPKNERTLWLGEIDWLSSKCNLSIIMLFSGDHFFTFISKTFNHRQCHFKICKKKKVKFFNEFTFYLTETQLFLENVDFVKNVRVINWKCPIIIKLRFWGMFIVYMYLFLLSVKKMLLHWIKLNIHGSEYVLTLIKRWFLKLYQVQNKLKWIWSTPFA